MALIQCRDCDKQVSKRAYFCPQCGGYTRNGYLLLSTFGLTAGAIWVAVFKYFVF